MRHRWGRRARAAGAGRRCVPLFMLANKDFLPEDDESQFEVTVRAPEGTSLDADQIIANASPRHPQMPEVEYTLVTVGDDPARTQNRRRGLRALKPIESARAISSLS